MSERIVVTRRVEMRRGGTNNNLAGPVWTIVAINKSGGAVARGDVVVWDKTSNSTPDQIAFTTTTSGNNVDVLGMVFDNSIANGAFGNIQIWGPTDALKVDGTTDISIGDLISTFTTAKIGQKTTGAGAFARAQEAYATNDSSGVIDAFIQCAQSPLPSSSVATLADAGTLVFGDGSDITMQWDGTDFLITGGAANNAIKIGNANQLDVVFIGNDDTTDSARWDGSANTLGLSDNVKLGFGNNSTTPDVTVTWDEVDLEIAAAANNSAINFGNGTNSFDLKAFGSAAANFALWDASANVLQFQDSVKVGFGNASTQPDVTITWDATDLEIAAAANNSVINFGDGTTSFDVSIFGSAAANFILWDASANVLQFQDNVKIGFGNASTAPDVTITWDTTDLQVAAAAANSVITIGDANQMDVVLVGANDTTDSARWDGSANTFGVSDNVKIGFGNNSTTPDVTITWDATDLEIAAAADDSVINFGNGTNSFDVRMYGNAAGTYLEWDASADDLLFMDNVSAKFGTGADIEIRWDSTDLDVLAVGDDLVIKWGNGTNSIDQWWYGNAAADYMLWDASNSRLDLLGTATLRLAAIGTLDFAAQAAGTATFTITGLTSADVVVLSPREATQGALVIDKVESAKVTIRNTASESANVECNYLVIAKAS